MNLSAILIVLGLLIFFSHVLNALFEKIRIPNVLVLMLIGVLGGPVMGWINPEYLGNMGSVFTTVTLIAILFESGTNLKFETLKKTILSASLLTTLNFLVAMSVGFFIGEMLLGLDTLSALFMGAALGGTSSAVVIPMVRQLRSGEKAASILYLESALSDVFCLVVALALLGGIKTGAISVAGIFQKMGLSFLFSIILGLVAGFFWIIILKKWLKAIKNSMFTSFALAFILYGLAEQTGLNGGICILSYGIMAGNIGSTRFVRRLFEETEESDLNPQERLFYSEIVFILQTYFFVFIGISIQLSNPWYLLAGILFVVSVFSLRLVTTHILGSKDMELRDKKLISALGPRGLVAAVLASLPLQYAQMFQATTGNDPKLLAKAQSLITGGQTIQDVSYAVVLISILLCSAWIWVIERKRNPEKSISPTE